MSSPKMLPVSMSTHSNPPSADSAATSAGAPWSRARGGERERGRKRDREGERRRENKRERKKDGGGGGSKGASERGARSQCGTRELATLDSTRVLGNIVGVHVPTAARPTRLACLASQRQARAPLFGARCGWALAAELDAARATRYGTFVRDHTRGFARHGRLHLRRARRCRRHPAGFVLLFGALFFGRRRRVGGTKHQDVVPGAHEVPDGRLPTRAQPRRARARRRRGVRTSKGAGGASCGAPWVMGCEPGVPWQHARATGRDAALMIRQWFGTCAIGA